MNVPPSLDISSDTAPFPANDAAEGMAAPVQEIFSSVQGEGVHVGKRQIFVRFAHCHLKCAYCDTPMTSPTGKCHIETPPGSGQVRYADNPMSVDAVLGAVDELLLQARHHSVSFTGGEPLLYHRFLHRLFPEVHARTKVYLETSGTQPEFLESVLPWVDIVAMDIKLPSTTGEPNRFEAHKAFYRLARSAPTEVFVKLIFNERTTDAELEAVEGIVPDPDTPIILQPVTSLEDRCVHVPPHEIFRIEHRLSKCFRDVRVIPQTHKMLKIL